ncbi:hypothetical protein DTW90_12105 [Neorhizobium sp. P12A]|uniref:hypothetical protein n=1 Tax=Neorhizobium sp. P12A TaxID=2268027 RepID=UPI0011EDD592|nr:hypothetical protein [Neorhizobium sp. P12A]KAA0698543.1 hypothetical protein DTW90_12105 [Neorhizobium sp. P12A]
MTPVTANIKSVAEQIADIHSIRAFPATSEQREKLQIATDRLTVTPCQTVDDAMALISFSGLLSELLFNKVAADPDSEEAALACYLYTYLGRAASFLETILKDHAVQNGVATLN